MRPSFNEIFESKLIKDLKRLISGSLLGGSPFKGFNRV